jgi:hypothetical protein
MVVRNPLPPRARRVRTRPRDDGTRYRSRLLRAWRAFGLRLPRMRREIARFASAHADRVRGTIRRAAIGAALGVLAAVVGIAVLATAAVLLVNGIAGGLAAAFGGNAWLGNLVAGVGLLLLVGVAIAVLLRRDRTKRMRALAERYARYDEPTPVVRRDGAGEHGARPEAVHS